MEDIFGGLVRECVEWIDSDEDILATRIDANACTIEGDKVLCMCDGCLGGCVFAEDGPFEAECLHYGDYGFGTCESDDAKWDRMAQSVFGSKQDKCTMIMIEKDNNHEMDSM
jgi:hypothetical protein